MILGSFECRIPNPVIWWCFLPLEIDRQTMEKRSRLPRIFSVVPTYFTGLNALIAGGMFISDPTGEGIGMDRSYLAHSPFTSFLIPGIVLFTVNGLLNVVTGTLVLMRRGPYAWLTMFQGVMLGGWILVQMILVRDFNALHAIMLTIGFALLGCGWWTLRATRPS